MEAAGAAAGSYSVVTTNKSSNHLTRFVKSGKCLSFFFCYIFAPSPNSYRVSVPDGCAVGGVLDLCVDGVGPGEVGEGRLPPGEEVLHGAVAARRVVVPAQEAQGQGAEEDVLKEIDEKNRGLRNVSSFSSNYSRNIIWVFIYVSYPIARFFLKKIRSLCCYIFILCRYRTWNASPSMGSYPSLSYRCSACACTYSAMGAPASLPLSMSDT